MTNASIDSDKRHQLGHREAFADHAHVASLLKTEGSPIVAPLVTIAIPTFRRRDLLVEAVVSAIAQDFDRPFEIVVVDNDPDSTDAEYLLEQLPGLAARGFRYYVNVESIGAFGNWNRCITNARGAWVTILNDDDLLDASYLRQMFDELERRDDIDGLVSRKRFLDERQAGATGTEAPASTPPARLGLLGSILRSPRLRSPARRLKLRAREEYLFAGKPSRRITARKFFWGSILGNGGGFIFRRAAAIAIGGYYPEEYPSADYWFYARFAHLCHLREHRAVAATIRITGSNLTSTSVIEQLQQGLRLQRLLVETIAPRWWLRYLPLMLSCAREGFNRCWGSDVGKAEIEEALGVTLPPANYRKLDAIRLLLRAE